LRQQGLSITHGMVQDHGGRLEVESVPGQGTRFRVILPVARPEK
jgi:two-component system, NtrC family, sensor kinase